MISFQSLQHVVTSEVTWSRGRLSARKLLAVRHYLRAALLPDSHLKFNEEEGENKFIADGHGENLFHGV